MIPKNLNYGSKIASAPARSKRINVAPQNGTSNYGLGDTIIINIPTQKNLVMVPSESYLKFDVEFTNADPGAVNYRFDSSGAHSLISRLRVFHGSNLLQDIDAYGTLAKMLFDLQVSTPASYGKHSILSGQRNDLVSVGSNVTIPSTGTTAVNGVTMDAGAATAAQLATILTSVVQAQAPVTNVNSGAYIPGLGGANTAVATTAKSVKQTYCLNLISLVGSLCQQQYLPLFGMTSSPLRVEIQLQDSLIKALGVFSPTNPNPTGAGTMTITNCEFVANFIELNDQAMDIVYGNLDGKPLQFVVPDWRNFQYSNTPGNNAQIAMPIAAKMTSLKSLFITARERYNTVNYFPHSCSRNGLKSYQFRVGSDVMPPKSPDTIPEMFSEVLKAIGSMSDINHAPNIDLTSYSLNASVALTALGQVGGSIHSGSFYIGIDLENYANADKSQIFAGFNTNTCDIYCMLTYDVVANAVLTRYDAYALFDTLVVCENSTCYVRF